MPTKTIRSHDTTAPRPADRSAATAQPADPDDGAVAAATAGAATTPLVWYGRVEVAAPWRLVLCEAHAASLRPFRFAPIAAPSGREARGCAVCERPDLLRVVENCTCETDAGNCPEHRNLGCSC